MSTDQSSPSRRRRFASAGIAAALATVLIGILPKSVHSFSPLHYQSHSFVRNNRARGHQQLRMYKDFVNDAEASQTPASFEQRMRERFVRNTQKTSPLRNGRRNGAAGLPPNVKIVETLADYKSEVSKAIDGMLVVRFYAKWCRSCKQIAPSFYKLAKLNPEITFLEVPVTENNANLHQGLGVPSIPYSHIYYKGVIVEEMKISRKRFPAFASKVNIYARGTCDCSDEECSDIFVEKFERNE